MHPATTGIIARGSAHKAGRDRNGQKIVYAQRLALPSCARSDAPRPTPRHTPHASCPTPHAPCIMPYAPRPMHHALRPMHHALRPTPYASRPTPYALRHTLHTPRHTLHVIHCLLSCIRYLLAPAINRIGPAPPIHLRYTSGTATVPQSRRGL